MTIDFKNEISNFVFTNKYARYNEDKGRRETWRETVARVMNMHLNKYSHLDDKHKNEIRWAFDMVYNKKVVPSMRSMQFGGIAIEAHNSRMFNCSVRHIDSIRSFAEVFYLLLCGTGVGFGVSKFFLDRLPDLVGDGDKTGSVITYVIEDNIEGWADSIEAQLNCYFRNTAYTGRKIIFDYSKIRPAGTPLKTGGGKAPGYKGLKRTHIKIKELLDHIIEEEHHKRLQPIHAYDILMHASDAVLSGGIRRSATICIFDKSDEAMMNAKTYFEVTKYRRFVKDEEDGLWHGRVRVKGRSKEYEVAMNEWAYEDMRGNKRISWLYIEPQRARSNNSVLLIRDKATKKDFEEIIQRTRDFGEPGFVFANHPWTLANPCVEIGFIPVTEDGQCGVQMCNLTSINGAEVNTKEDFMQACKAASILGTLQATYTHFPYLRPTSQQLTEEEALLGVSITGIMDNPKVLLNEDYLQEGAHKAIVTNKKWAKVLGINQAARVTCVKPEGTSSLLLGSASGIHPYHSRKFIRRIQCNKLDPVYKFIKKLNPHMCEESLWSANKTDDVINFPIEISEKAMIKSDLTAIEHLKIIKKVQENWVEAGIVKTDKPVSHNVSCTVIVKDNEWTEVLDYIYKNRDYYSGISLIPATGDKDFKQAPLENVVTEEDEKYFKELVEKYTPVDYTQLKEKEDKTKLVDVAACAGGSCELI